MSVSSYSSVYSSSSSSSSNSSSSGTTGEFSSSSGATGKFSSSSAASFSSCSTIVAPQPVVQPFGCPDYNYFWIENKSKTNPKQSYFYNFKSHSVVWERPVSKDVPLPFYTYAWSSVQRQLSEDEEDVIVSDPEDELRRKKRLEVKRRNRRLVSEEIDHSIEVISVKKAVKSKKMLDTLWKLYRLPGETLQDVKKRMLESSENQIKIKSEEISKDECNTNNITNVHIKQEPVFDISEYALNIENVNKTIKTQDGDSDSDPENVSYLIKQEYMMHYEDSELGNDSENEEKTQEVAEELNDDEDEDTEEEDSDEVEELVEQHYIKRENNYDMTDMNMTNTEHWQNGFDDLECDYDATYLLADLLDIEIIENSEENIVLQPDDSLDDGLKDKNINWEFEKSAEIEDNSMLTRSVLEPIYNAPKLKQISNKHLLHKKKKKKKKQKQKKEEKRVVPKIIIKTDGPVMRIKRESEDDADKPIICDMYGTRTINYNHPLKIKIPRWQSCSKLTDSSADSSESELENRKIKEKFKDVDQNSITSGIKTVSPIKIKPENALELRNWFPQRKNKKRKRTRKKSDSSWCESNLSDYSDICDFDVRLIKMKKEKNSSTQEFKKERSPTPEFKMEKSPTPKYKEERSILECENDRYIIEEDKENYVWTNNSIAMPSKRTIKEEVKSPPHSLEAEEPETLEIIESMTPTESAVDVSIVKTESRHFDLEDDWQSANVVTKPNQNGIVDNTLDSDSNSSSSSCSCSKSSCACSSSSSSSSSSDDEGDKKDVQEVKQEIKMEIQTEGDQNEF